MAQPSSALPLALAMLLLTGSAAAQSALSEPPAPSAPPPGYYPAPRPPYGPVYGPPYATAPIYPTSRLYSTAMLATGIAASVVGSLAAVFGTVAYLNNDFNRCFEFDGFSCEGPSHGVDTFVMAAGGIVMLTGIPLIAIGSRRVRVRPQDAAFIPVLTASPRGGSLTFQF
jgi:hypothetical protein